MIDCEEKQVNKALRHALSTSAFIYAMDPDLVQNSFSAQRDEKHIEVDHETSILMAEFLKDASRMINEKPIDAIECYFSLMLDRHLLADTFMKYMKKEFWSVHGPYGRYVDPSSPEEIGRKNSVNGCREAVLFAKTVGAKVVVVHPGFSTQYDVPRELRINHSIESIKKMADFAGEHGIKLAVEPMPKLEIGNTLEETIHIILSVNHPNVGMNFDTNHLYPAADIPNLIKQAGSLLTSIHISDQDDIERHWLPFAGKVNWEDVLKALIDVEYQGPLVYETHVRDASSVDEVGEIVTDNYAKLMSLMPEGVTKG